jgi:pilus assembly protein CpaE
LSNSDITLLDKSEKSIDKIGNLLKNISDFEIDRTGTSIDLLDSLIKDKTPVIVIMGPEFTLVDLENYLKDKSMGLGLIKVILLVKDPSANIYRKAIKLNVFDVLEFPFNYKDLKESLHRAHTAILDSGSKRGKSGAEKSGKVKTDQAKSIVIFSSKGGTGKSFIAANLAIDLHIQTKKRVGLLDLDYESGDIALILDITPKHTVYDISSIVNQLDVEMMNSFLTGHGSGIKVLPAPVDPSQSESISTKATLKILDVMTKICDYVVIDLPSNFSENNLAILENIDVLCMVASMDILSVKNLKVALEIISQLKFPDDKTFLIINRANSKVGITLDEIEATLTRKIDLTIPSDRVIPLSINQGNPVVESYPRSTVSRSISQLTKLITKDEKEK